MNTPEQTGRIAAVGDYPGGHVWLRATTALAGHIRPGQYVQINAQPWAVMRAGKGWLVCLQRGLPLAAVDTEVSITGPWGDAFDPAKATPRTLLLGGEGGIAALVFLTDVLRHRRPRLKPFLLLASEQPFPFRPQPSRIMVPGLPTWVIAAMPLLEDWGIPSRLATPQGLPGCFDGSLEELARGWLKVSQGVADVTVYACGPPALLAGARRLAEEYRLPCQTVEAVF